MNFEEFLTNIAILCPGYVGHEDLYFSTRELIAAYEGEGLALDYWAGFDSTWKQPWHLGERTSSPCPAWAKKNHLLLDQK